MDSRRFFKSVIDALGVSKAELAELMEVDQSYVTHLMNEGRTPSIEVLERLSKKMEVPLWILIMAGYPEEMRRFLGDGSSPDFEKKMPKNVVKFVLAMRLSLLREKKS